MTVPIKRRSPADQIRYCVDRLNEIHAQSSSEQTALIASRHLLATLAEQLDATLTEPETGLSTGAAFLVDAIRNARISELHEAFEHLGWTLHFQARERPASRPRQSVCECGTTPDPGLCPINHDKTLPAGGHCACVHTKETASA